METMFTWSQIQQMAAAGMFAMPQVGQNRGKATVDLPPSEAMLWGPNGVFSRPGVNPNAVNAMPAPDQGLRGVLPWRPSQYGQEVLRLLTGLTAGSGDEPTENCTPGPKAGNWKWCHHSWPFGQYKMTTETIDLSQLGALMNRCDTIDARIMGNPWAEVTRASQGININPRDIFRNEITARIAAMFVEMDRRYHILDTTGNHASTADNEPGAYHEHYGSQYIINTGYVDFYSEKRCLAADSWVLSMGGLDIETNGAAYVQTMVELYDYMVDLARRVGLAPIEFAWRMTRGAFRALANAWQCNYNTMACASNVIATDNATIMINDQQSTRDRDAMLAGYWESRNIGPYLPIRGTPVRVIIEDPQAFPEGGSGPFTGEIELWPLSSPQFTETGGAISYYEFFDWNAPYAAGAVMRELGGMRNLLLPLTSVERGGRTLLYSLVPQDLCVGFGAIEKYRLINRAPFLSARLTNVAYTQRFHQRSSDPTSAFLYNGGVTDYSAYPQFDGYPPRGES